MATSIALSAAIRANLLSLQGTQELIARTQNRLSTGLRVASPLDDGRAFFEAKSLNDRAFDISEKKDGIDQAISAVKVALDAAEAIDSIVKQMKGLAISARTATGNELTEIVNQFNELRSQVDAVTTDSVYQGVTLVNGTTSSLTVEFGTDSTSALTINGVDLRVLSGGLNISSAAGFSVAANIDSALIQLDAAVSELRGHAQSLGSRVALLQTRLAFTKSYVNNLEEGAGKLTIADVNEEGANLVALQTRQQLGMSALAFAGQAEQAILQLFR
ncbi:MAG: flagellin [Alphaproteobacteria bacterium]